MENIEEQIVLDYKNGLTIKQIEEKFHTSFYNITKIFDKYGVPHNRKTKKEARQKAFLAKKNEVIKFYLAGNGLNKCAKKFGVYDRDIKNLLRDNKIPLRNYKDSIYFNGFDKNFFKNQNHDMAWLLGFLAADGSISKNSNAITIQLAKIDREILEKIRYLIGSTNQITSYTNSKGFDVVSFRWSCAEHKKDLAEYSVIPNKTFHLFPPYKLQKEYWGDYIRGYFDGDGSINLIKNSNGRGEGNLRWQLCSATKEILVFVLNFFEENNIPRVSIQERKGQNPLYTISYSSNATRKIYQVLYNGKSEMYLQRKRDHYEEILSKVSAN